MKRRERLVGILLAAGASQRMGTPKPLLPFGDRTTLEQCLFHLQEGSIKRVVVVLGCARNQIEELLAPLFQEKGIQVAFNERYREGMLSSVQCGIRAAEALRPDGYLVSLVDQPFVTATTIRAVVDAFCSTEKRIVVPTFEGQRGHPICLDASLRDAILSLDIEGGGLRTLIRRLEEETLLVPLSSDEILRDMDTPEDYHRELERWRFSCPHTTATKVP